MSVSFMLDEQFVLERKRIHALLENAVQNSVLLITAGGGYGKTYAVNSFLRKKNKTAVWISLSERDNDPLHFWESVIKAVSFHSPRTGKYLEEIGFPESHNQITRCFSILSGTIQRKKEYVIVADNFHVINEKSILDFAGVFLASPYPRKAVILISLREPELNTMGLLSKGLLSRITANDLRFNEEEISSYFHLRNIRVSPEEAKKIFTDTEGWILAISLVAEEMKSSGKKYTRCLLHEGSIRDMIDTLFASIPASYQRFLVTISFFNQWPLEVISKVTGSMRETLPPEEEQIVYLNHLSALYRYDVYLHGFRIHPLFLDYLRERQRELSRQEIKTACSINAQWCMENRLLTDAIINYGAAGDYEGILKTIYSSPRILSRAAAATFLEILDRFLANDKQNENDKYFIFLRYVTRAGLFLSMGRFDESGETLEKGIREFERKPMNPLTSWILSACYNTLGTLTLFTYRTKRDLSRTCEYFIRGNSYYMLNPYIVSGPASKTTTGSYAALIGNPPREGEFEEFISVISMSVPHTSNSIGGYLEGADSLCQAELSYFKGELNAAEQYARESVFRAREKEQYEIESKSLFYLLRIYLCTGDISAVRETWAQVETMRGIPDYLNRYVIYDIMTGWVYAHTGATERVAPWLRNEFEESDLNLHYQNYETMVKAKSLFAEKRYADVVKFLEQKEIREGLGSFHLGMLEITVLRMAALGRMGEEAEALKILEAAYRMALLYAIEMPFIELGDDMRFLAGAALALTPDDGEYAIPRPWLETMRNKASVYAKKLNKAAEQFGDVREEEKIPFLKSQELSILTGISQGLTREEIAGEESLSVSSVKNVIKTIYDKLGAINRADAIRIATEMGLLR